VKIRFLIKYSNRRYINKSTVVKLFCLVKDYCNSICTIYNSCFISIDTYLGNCFGTVYLGRNYYIRTVLFIVFYSNLIPDTGYIILDIRIANLY